MQSSLCSSTRRVCRGSPPKERSASAARPSGMQASSQAGRGAAAAAAGACRAVQHAARPLGAGQAQARARLQMSDSDGALPAPAHQALHVRHTGGYLPQAAARQVQLCQPGRGWQQRRDHSRHVGRVPRRVAAVQGEAREGGQPGTALHGSRLQPGLPERQAGQRRASWQQLVQQLRQRGQAIHLPQLQLSVMLAHSALHAAQLGACQLQHRGRGERSCRGLLLLRKRRGSAIQAAGLISLCASGWLRATGPHAETWWAERGGPRSTRLGSTRLGSTSHQQLTTETVPAPAPVKASP